MTIEWQGIYQKNPHSLQPSNKIRVEGGGGGTLRYMKLQQGMSIDFSLFGFCDLFVKMGIDFKHFDLS